MPPQGIPGRIVKFDRTKGYGFIHGVQGLSQDVYLKASHAEFDLVLGDKVDFVLEWSRQGKPQASSVSRSMAEGEAMLGTVKSFNPKNMYGFVTCEGHSRDVYFQQKDLPQDAQAAATEGALVGTVVRFVVKLASDGKPQLKNMTVVEVPGAPLRTAPQDAKRKAMLEPIAKRKAGQAVEPLAKRQRTMEAPKDELAEFQAAEGHAAEQVHGWVKSFNPQKGYGFINSDEVEGDVWFRKLSLPPSHQNDSDLKGCQVAFALGHAPDGKPQAQHVQVLASAAGVYS